MFVHRLRQRLAPLTFLLAVTLVGGVVVAPPAALAVTPTCQGSRATIVGTAKADKLTGTGRKDVIIGLGGDDDISGLGGNDIICGGPGNDVLRGGAGRDLLAGGDGHDVIIGGAGADRGVGGRGVNLCTQVERVTGCRAIRAGTIAVAAPARSSAPTVVLRGLAPAGATVRVLGGLAPATVRADADGAFRVSVVLQPARRNDLRLSARVAGRAATVTTRVSVLHVDSTGTRRVTGRVVNPEGHPVARARVRYGSHAAVTAADGTFTVTGLPAGRIALRATATGHLGSLATVDTKAPGAPLTIVVQPLATPVTVTAAGGTFQGTGYRLVIPRDAVTRPTQLAITPLVFTGTKDDYGMPIVDLSPSGLTFQRPITVTIDPAVIGASAKDTTVLGLNPDTGVVTPLTPQIVGGKLQVSLRTLNGLELRLPLELLLGDQCTPYASPAAATLVRVYLQQKLLPELLSVIGPDSWLLWSRYLAGGAPTRTRNTLTLLGNTQFALAPQTLLARSDVVTELGLKLNGRAAVPPLKAPAAPVTRRVKDYKVGQNLDINYSLPITLSGNIAG
ncbi:MAG TPA: carboxypeptidase regulatory-like domain-containing protein, partial [Actinoplanes sp.]|nr:carboxypeptidase regulatory-like domain-containing protein [Actinoplanes sp.]